MQQVVSSFFYQFSTLLFKRDRLKIFWFVCLMLITKWIYHVINTMLDHVLSVDNVMVLSCPGQKCLASLNTLKKYSRSFNISPYWEIWHRTNSLVYSYKKGQNLDCDFCSKDFFESKVDAWMGTRIRVYVGYKSTRA